ncbi:MAG: sensor domain-containing protein [Gammaproteobacteria bacterium]
MTDSTPKNVEQYLEQLRSALADADAAMRQDALYDAEEYLRAELAGNPGQPESEVLARICNSYGAPDEVAEVYRQREETVNEAMRMPARPVQDSALARFFGIYLDPYAYTSMFFMLLALPTGVIYFTVVVTGGALSLGFMILIIGIPFFLLYLGVIRLFAFLEGRLIEAFSGIRMPRRQPYEQKDKPILTRIMEMLTDSRTWLSMVYMLLKLPLGIAYFTAVVTLVSLSLGFIFGPFGEVTTDFDLGQPILEGWSSLILVPIGVLLLTASLHLFRGVMRIHANISKGLLTQVGE